MDSNEIVQLNVGGTLFSTYRSTLLQKINDEHHYLEELVKNNASNQTIFIDRNPRYFEYILDYMRSRAINESFLMPASLDIINSLQTEAKFYNLNSFLIDLALNPSAILSHQQKINLLNLCNFPLNLKWKLIYRATVDGFSAANFHSKCDGKSNTLTIIKSMNSCIFGGYTEAFWTQHNRNECDSNSFIFSLENLYEKPLLIKCTYPNVSIYGSKYNGPIFGGGYGLGLDDLNISDESNLNSNSYSNLNSNYSCDYLDTIDAKCFLAGSINFQISEIEVFQKFY